MQFGSLFAGIGGFDLGFEKAGMTGVYQVEKDKDCNRILARHFPNATKYNDVTTCASLPVVDVLAGGFPCQDLSVAGKRKGLAGERSGLWYEFLRIVASTHPRYVVIENVPGLLSSHKGRDFAIILQGLVECGYGVAWRVLDAQYAGLAQRRERVFIVGSLGNGRAAEILFEPEGVSWNPPTRSQAGQNTTADVGGSVESCSRGIAAPEVPTLRRALQERDAKGPDSSTKDGHLIVGALPSHSKRHGHAMTTQQAAESNQIVTHAQSMRHDSSEDGTGRGTPLVVAKAVDVRNLRLQPGDCSVPLQSKKSGGHSLNYTNPVVSFAENQRGELRTSDISPQLSAGGGKPGSGYSAIAFSSKDHGADAGELSPTLRSMEFDKSHMNGGGQVAVAFHENKAGMLSEAEDIGLRSGASHSYQGVGTSSGVRRLTPTECERLQGFPDGWTATDAAGKPVSDSARYRMLGNAVAVPVAEWIGRRIMEAGNGDM